MHRQAQNEQTIIPQCTQVEFLTNISRTHAIGTALKRDTRHSHAGMNLVSARYITLNEWSYVVHMSPSYYALYVYVWSNTERKFVCMCMGDEKGVGGSLKD